MPRKLRVHQDPNHAVSTTQRPNRLTATAETSEPELHPILRLQQQIGNQATMRRLQRVTAPADLDVARRQRQAALLNHAKDKGALVKAVEDGLKMRSTDRRLANSCEWVKAGKAKLYAATTTGDTDDRISQAGMDDTKDLALFPKGVSGGDDHIFGATNPTYKYDDLDDNTGVDLDDDGKVTNGWNLPGRIAIYHARNVPVAAVWSTLRHEVQHDADHSDDKTTLAPNNMEENFEGFKTEYRAYNYQQTGYDNKSITTNVNKYGYTWKERQLAIFEHIWSGYDHTKEFWDDTDVANAAAPSTKGTPDDNTVDNLRKAEIEARQTRLVAYSNPDTEGFNKWNSVRVENFYQALKAVPDNTSDKTIAEIVELLTKAAALKLEDARYIRAESPDFQAMLTRKLTGEAQTAVYAKIGKK